MFGLASTQSLIPKTLEYHPSALGFEMVRPKSSWAEEVACILPPCVRPWVSSLGSQERLLNNPRVAVTTASPKMISSSSEVQCPSLLHVVSATLQQFYPAWGILGIWWGSSFMALRFNGGAQGLGLWGWDLGSIWRPPKIGSHQKWVKIAPIHQGSFGVRSWLRWLESVDAGKSFVGSES